MAKKKKKTVGQMGKKLWKITSELVRRTGADSNGYTSCKTCGAVKHWKELQAGHFIPQAQGNAVKYDLRNLETQCYRCNINLGSNGPEFYPYMLKKHGQETIDELRRLSNTTVKFTLLDYEEMIAEREEMLNQLEE